MGWMSGFSQNTRSPQVYYFQAAKLEPLETNFAPLEPYDSGTVLVQARAFDRATIEYVNGQFEIPPEIDTADNVTLKILWFARVVPGTSENVLWTFEEVATANGEDFDGAYTGTDFSVSGTGTTQDGLIIASKTISLSSLGWAAGDIIHFRISRKATDATDTFDNNATQTNDDAMLVGASIIIPQTA